MISVNNVNNLDFTADSVVEDFYTTINYIVSLYQAANNNVVPKINLMGHSQGTIVNLLYATKFPDRIDSMYALGGLFNGSAILRAIYGVGTGTIER